MTEVPPGAAIDADDAEPEWRKPVPRRRMWYSAKAAEVAATTPDVPPRLRATLVILALFSSDDDGHGCYPSWATLARVSGQSVRQIGRNLDELQQLGFIRRGDQGLTSRIPPGRRPVVYDLGTAPELPEVVKPAKAARVSAQPKPLTKPWGDHGPYSNPQFTKLWTAVTEGYEPTSEEWDRCSANQLERLDEAEASRQPRS